MAPQDTRGPFLFMSKNCYILLMNSEEIRSRFLKFFEERGHKVVLSASLIPENDPTTLFTSSGMQPMLPYLLGQKHPLGTKLVDSQKSFRAVDIDEVGDNRHTTFFEMLGNWSFGDYFKEKQIPWMFEFLVEEIGIDPNKLYVTAFMGEEKNNLPKDIESADIWKSLFASKNIEAKIVDIGSEENGYKTGMQNGRIFYYDSKKNWWSRAGTPDNMPVGEPGGPDSEMFYKFTEVIHDPKFGEYCHPNCDCGQFIEIGNNVFMEYKKNENGSFSNLPQKNVDFGGGFERIAAATLNKPDVFQIDIFQDIIKAIENISKKSYSDPKYTKAFRIIADHIRAATFLIGDGVYPSNSDQGYYVRRLIRRATFYWDKLDMKISGPHSIVRNLLEFYKESYPETYLQAIKIEIEIKNEEEKFRKSLDQGLKQFEKGEDPFVLFTSYGFPFELTKELASEKGIKIDEKDFQEKFRAHQDLSRSGAEQKFKGGLAGTGEQEVKYHTATHLLHQALRDVLGDEVSQKGSNITAKRLRFDFAFPRKMTGEEKQKVEEIVNAKIKQALPVDKLVLPKEEAEKTGALHFFGDRYGDSVNVYFIGDSIENAYSKEFCGGPHVSNTSELGVFKISKEEAVSAGVRRIKAVLTS